MKIILMADGLGSRWTAGRGFVPPAPYKQLIPINGVPLIYRTINQCFIQGFDDILVVAPDEFKLYHPWSQYVEFTTLGYRETVGEFRPLLDGILRTQSFWENPTLVLLGDVCFSNEAIQAILFSDRERFIAGRQGPNPITDKAAGELFALKFTDLWDTKNKLRQCLNKSYSKLWDFYNYFPNIELLHIKDYTDDIDSPQAYMQFFQKLADAVLDDDYGVTDE